MLISIMFKYSVLLYTDDMSIRRIQQYDENSTGEYKPRVCGGVGDKRAFLHKKTDENNTNSSSFSLSCSSMKLDAVDSGYSNGNINDVCFGCDGACRDTNCASKRSSGISTTTGGDDSKRSSRASAADVESNAQTPYASPVLSPDEECPPPTTTKNHVIYNDDDATNRNSVRRSSSSLSLNHSYSVAVQVTQEDSENGNNNSSQSDSPIRWLPANNWDLKRAMSQQKSGKGQRSPSNKARGKKKRLHSQEDEDSPVKR